MRITSLTALFALVLCYCLTGEPENISILEAPAKLPYGMTLGNYSPPLGIGCTGLNPEQIYTLKAWLLTTGLWYRASTQWCERTDPLDNSGGTNLSGTIWFTADMDCLLAVHFVFPRQSPLPRVPVNGSAFSRSNQKQTHGLNVSVDCPVSVASSINGRSQRLRFS